MNNKYLTTNNMEYKYFYPRKAKHNYIVVLNKPTITLYFGYIGKDMAYSISKGCLGVWRIKYKN